MATRPDTLALRTALAGGLLVALGLGISNLSASGPTQERDLHDSRSTAPTTPATSAPTAASPVDARASTRQAGTPAARLGTKPLQIWIPTLGVDAPVVPISTVDGELEPPADPRTIGWWDGGARPGATTGSAVMTGHTVHNGGGAFDDLDTLQVGDLVRVETRARIVVYRVTSSTVYPTDMFAQRSSQVFDQGSRGRLVLITCEDWNGEDYDSNAVVVAEQVRPA